MTLFGVQHRPWPGVRIGNDDNCLQCVGRVNVGRRSGIKRRAESHFEQIRMVSAHLRRRERGAGLFPANEPCRMERRCWTLSRRAVAWSERRSGRRRFGSPLIGGIRFMMRFTRTRPFAACPGGRRGPKICRPQAELSGGGTRSHSSPLVGRGEKDFRDRSAEVRARGTSVTRSRERPVDPAPKEQPPRKLSGKKDRDRDLRSGERRRVRPPKG
jgi:hypothetical protein